MINDTYQFTTQLKLLNELLMKHCFLLNFVTAVFFTAYASCSTDNVISNKADILNRGNNKDSMSNKINMRIGSNTFSATLTNDATGAAFKALLPLTINMKELNGNEKYFDLPTKLPADPSTPAGIQTGDLMLYGSNTLVLFYKTFSTPYSYTKIGKVDNVASLAAALGNSNVTVTFELQ
jgi:hypothetical protein